MAFAKLKYLSEDEVKAIAKPILEEKFQKFGLGDTGIVEEEDFDGAHVFRMTADVDMKVPAEVLVDTISEIHQALRKIGENRYVYLSTRLPGDADADEDLE